MTDYLKSEFFDLELYGLNAPGASLDSVEIELSHGYIPYEHDSGRESNSGNSPSVPNIDLFDISAFDGSPGSDMFLEEVSNASGQSPVHSALDSKDTAHFPLTKQDSIGAKDEGHNAQHERYNVQHEDFDVQHENHGGKYDSLDDLSNEMDGLSNELSHEDDAVVGVVIKKPRAARHSGPRKKEEIMERNRLAAKEARLKKKHYVSSIEEELVALREKCKLLSERNNALVAENRALRENNSMLQSTMKTGTTTTGISHSHNHSSNNSSWTKGMGTGSGATAGTVLFSIMLVSLVAGLSVFNMSAGSIAAVATNPAKSGRSLLSLAQFFQLDHSIGSGSDTGFQLDHNRIAGLMVIVGSAVMKKKALFAAALVVFALLCL